MDERKMVPLKFTNNWEAHEYIADGKFVIAHMTQIFAKDKKTGAFEPVKVKSCSVSVEYSDMGIRRWATSRHYFVEVIVLGVKVDIPFETLISKKPKKFFVDLNEVKTE